MLYMWVISAHEAQAHTIPVTNLDKRVHDDVWVEAPPQPIDTAIGTSLLCPHGIRDGDDDGVSPLRLISALQHLFETPNKVLLHP